MAAPQSSAVSPAVALIVRLLTLVCLLISVVILATNNTTVPVGGFGQVKIKFNDFYAYRYILATGVIGTAYTVLQIAFTAFRLSSGGDGSILLDFYGDKVLSYILATGAAAGFGFTVDLNRVGNDSDTTKFLNKANAAASLLCIGFVFSAVSSIFSSLSLSKRC